ncbi:hypothetical protein YC2023_042949 [Brassica napus]
MVQANLENLSPTDGRRQRESPTPASRERVPATLRLGPQVSLVDEEDNETWMIPREKEDSRQSKDNCGSKEKKSHSNKNLSDP